MENKEKVVSLINELLAVPHACGELKDIAKQYVDSIDTENETKIREELIKEIKEDVVPAEAAYGFLSSPKAIEFFGEERAKEMALHMKEIIANGGKYCDCAACAAALKVLEVLE